MNIKTAERVERLMRLRRDALDMLATPNKSNRREYNAVVIDEIAACHDYPDELGTQQGYETAFKLPLAYYDYMMRSLLTKIEQDLAALGVKP